MEACNERDYVKAEGLIEKIKEHSVLDKLDESD